MRHDRAYQCCSLALVLFFAAGVHASNPHAPVHYNLFKDARVAAEADLNDSAKTIETQYQTVVGSSEMDGLTCEYVSECHPNAAQQYRNAGATDQHVITGSNTPRSYKVPGFRFSTDSAGQPTNSAREKKVVCALSNLKNLWYDQKDQSGFWQSYYGDQSTGMWVSVPVPNGCVQDYDARFRPWYSSAATGPKDIIIVIDTSGSMNHAGRMTAAKNAAKAVIKTLSHADFATVISFNEEATSATPTLIRADTAGRKKLEDWIDDLYAPTKKTNYEVAVTLGFKIIEDSSGIGRTSKCSANTMMFLSDGDITVGAAGDDFLAKLQTLNHADFNMRIFTYAFGFESTLMNQMACAHGGLYVTVTDAEASTLKTKMAQYYELYAAGVHGSGVRWSEIYEDFDSGLDCITAAYPVYDLTQTPKQIFGVLGIDILPGDMNQKSDWNDTLRSMYDLTFSCPTFTMPDAEVEQLRTRFTGRNCADLKATLAASASAKEEPTGAVGAIVGGVVGGFALIAIFGFVYYRKKRRQRSKPNTPPSALELQLASMQNPTKAQQAYPVAAQQTQQTPVQGVVVAVDAHRGKNLPAYQA